MRRQKSIWKIVVGWLMLAVYIASKSHPTTLSPPTSQAEAVGRDLGAILFWLAAVLLIFFGFRGKVKASPQKDH